jgi:drug/metabolite transporter (DMT)-like permease
MDMKSGNDKKQILWSWLPVTCITALFCCVLWGSAPAMIKTAYQLFRIGSEDTASRIVLAGTRFTITGILTILIGSLLERKILIPHRSSWPKIGILGLIQTSGQYYFFFMAMAHLSGVRGSIINACGNFLTILFAVYIFRLEKMTLRKMAGCIVGLCGVILIVGAGQSIFSGGAVTFAGEGAMVTADIFVATGSCLTKIFSRTEDPVVLCGYQFAVGGLVLLLAGLAMGGGLTFYSISCLWVLLYLSFVSTGAYTLWSILLKYNPVSRVSILGFFNPVMGVVISALILGEVNEAFSLTGLVSLLLVSAGVVIVNMRSNAD